MLLADFHKDRITFNKYNDTVLKIEYWTIAFWRKIKDMQRNNEDNIILRLFNLQNTPVFEAWPQQRISNKYIYLFVSDQSSILGPREWGRISAPKSGDREP